MGAKLPVFVVVLLSSILMAGVSLAGHDNNDKQNQVQGQLQGQAQAQAQNQRQVGIVTGGDVATGDVVVGTDVGVTTGDVVVGTDVGVTTGDVSTSTSTGTATSTSTSTETSTSNSAVGTGNRTTINQSYDDDRPANTAAQVIATACSRGGSAQGMGLGGSLAFTNEMCDLALAAQLANDAGLTELRDKLIERAAHIALARGNKVREVMQYIPLIGQFM